MDTATTVARSRTAPPRPATAVDRAVVLRPDQKEAVTAVWREVSHGGRALVERCCGSGKTLIGAAVAHRLAARGRVLVLVNTIELLEQVAGAWSVEGGRRGLAVAACSSVEAFDRAQGGGHTDMAITTDAAALAQVTATVRGPVTVYATYASLERIVQAHALHALPPWDLVVVDESHHTAGASGKPWAAIHDDAKVPAARRVYFTATSRITDSDDEDDHDSGGPGEAAVYSMDNEEIFGKSVAPLSVDQGVALGLVADYQVLVCVVTDKDLRDLLREPPIADLRSRRTNAELQQLALQVAILRAANQYGLHHIITYHSRVDAARQFAATLPATAAVIPAAERPLALWTGAVAGDDRLGDRRKAFTQFARHGGADSGACAVLCNARLLGEGINIRACDAVAYIDPKTSLIDIIQGLGRAQRLPEDGSPKLARIILPIYLPDIPHATGSAPTDEEAQELDRSAFSTVWRVLEALSIADTRVTARITELRTNRSTKQPIVLPDQLDGQQDEEGDDEDDLSSAQGTEAVPTEVPWLHIDASAHQEAILRSVKLRMFSPRSREWERFYELAAGYYAEHGHLDVPDGEVRIWLNRQRSLRNSGLVDRARISELDAIGMIWSKHAAAWDRGFAYARAWHTRHGDLAIPATAKLDDYRIGSWARRQRQGHDDLTDEQRAQLEELDPLWRWDPKWQRSYRRFAACLAAGGALTGPRHRPGSAIDPAFRPGVWQHQQTTQQDRLHPHQITLLDALGDWRAP